MGEFGNDTKFWPEYMKGRGRMGNVSVDFENNIKMSVKKSGCGLDSSD
jgi:hypothetical protein